MAGRDIPFQWWQLFQSPALNSLIEKAFKANPTVTAAQAALAQAQELVYAQRGFYFPSVGATYQAERHKIAGNLTNDQAPGVQGNGDNLLPPLQTPGVPPYTAPLFYNFQTAELTVGFVPDVFGSNRRQVESLAAQTEVQRFALEATYITLASNVVAAAIQEASLRAQIRATQEIIAADEKALQILRDQFRLGQAMRIDVAAQETALAQAKATLPPLQLQFEQGRDLIRALVGNLPNQDVPETFELDALHLPPELPVSLPSKIIEQRPDVRAAEAQLHAANAQVGVAVAAMLPQFSITGSYGGNADQFSWMFRHGGPFWNLVGDVTQPLFQGGTLLHRKRAADQALKQAAAQYQERGDYGLSKCRRHAACVAVGCRRARCQRRRGEGGQSYLRSYPTPDGDRLCQHVDLAQRRRRLIIRRCSAACRRRPPATAIPWRCFRRSAAVGGTVWRRPRRS